jgi:hypothetical protein
VCTFINTPLGSATIIKETIGGNDTFLFEGDAPIGNFPLTTVGGTASTGNLFDYILAAGSYDVVETPIPAGWQLTAVDCVDGGLPGSSGSVPTATATLDVELAETVTCTFENTADGTLIIRKEVLPEDGVTFFDFTGDAAGSIRDYSLTGDELSVSGQPGIYASAETVPAGWELTDISCTGMTESTVDIGVGTAAFEPGDTNVSVDLAAGETVICTFENTAQGSITIEKLSVGGTGVFTFNTDFDGSFPLDTAGQNPASTTFSSLMPGSYTISEVVPMGWTLGDIQCSGNEASTVTIGAAGGFDPGDVGVTIDLVDGESVNCQFVNSAWGNIVVEKQTDPDGSAEDFGFTTSYGSPFSLTDGQTNNSGPLEPTVFAGTYSVAEDAEAGWDLTSATCDDGSDPSAIDLGAGETVTCTFTNTIQRGEIIVQKVTDPDTSQMDFEFITNYDAPFFLGHLETNNSGPLLPTSEMDGPYEVTETLPPGWNLDSATCDNGDLPSAITLDPGETVTCTFTNSILRGNIVVDKVTDPAGSAQPFDFTLTGTDVALAFALTDAAMPYDSGDLLPTSENGPYNVSETLPAGWNGTSASCDDGSDPAAVDLGPGETVTCTFTNTIQRGNIVVDKVTIPAGSPQSFDFTLAGTGVGQAFALTDTAMPYDSGSLLPTSENGTYNVSETLPPNWYTASATCDDGSEPANIDLAPGETVTCTFTNAQLELVPVPVNNPLALLLMVLGLLATGWYFRPRAVR